MCKIIHVTCMYGWHMASLRVWRLLPFSAITMETHRNVCYYPLRNKTSCFDPASLVMIIPF